MQFVVYRHAIFLTQKITYIFLITLAFQKADLLEILNMKDFDLIYSVSDISCVLEQTF